MNLNEQLTRIKEMMALNEKLSVDSWGRMHDENKKIVYPFKKITKFMDWFEKEYGDYARKQGWEIFLGDPYEPNIKYKHEPDNKYKLFYSVQRIDEPQDDQAQFGRLQDDFKAEELAKKIGLIIDEYGIIIGWDSQTFI